MTRFASPVLPLLACAMASACATGEPVRPNVVFILIDTLRADHVGAYGYDRHTTPFIDSLAENGLLFERAIAQAPWTTPSMASIWTSRFPSETGAVAVEGPSGQRHLEQHSARGMSGNLATLADLLAAEGYRTVAIVTNSYASAEFHLLRGFDEKRLLRSGATGVVDAAIEVLGEGDGPRSAGPFLLYVHFIDLHIPIRPRPPYDSIYPTLDGLPHTEEHSWWKYGDAEGLNTEEFRVYTSHKLALYDGALRLIDDEVRRLVSFLSDKGIADRTVMVVAADHGEEFWDHLGFEKHVSIDPRGLAGIGHGHSLFNQLLHVPLIFQGPGIPKGRVAAQVRNLDITPTLLGLAGVDTENLGLRGIDLLDAGEVPSQPAFSEDIAYGFEAKSLQNDRFKLVRYARTRIGKTEFLFDTREPLPENRDVLEENPEAAALLGSRLDELLRARRLLPGRDVTLTDETRDHLRSLGYLR